MDRIRCWHTPRHPHVSSNHNQKPTHSVSLFPHPTHHDVGRGGAVVVTDDAVLGEGVHDAVVRLGLFRLDLFGGVCVCIYKYGNVCVVGGLRI